MTVGEGRPTSADTAEDNDANGRDGDAAHQVSAT